MATKKALELELLIAELTKWSQLRKVEGDPYLKNLIADLSEGKNLHIWAEISPLEYLPHPVSILRTRESARVRVLTIIRNVLVFAPVALTWAAVGAATNGFSAYVKANGSNIVNFLDFWQNGYGYLSSTWRIGDVARLDFLIILAVIALTLYVSIAGHRAQQSRVDQEALIDQERVQIALNISHTLHDKKKITPLTMSQAVAGSISRLVSATRALESTAKAVNKLQKEKRA